MCQHYAKSARAIDTIDQSTRHLSTTYSRDCACDVRLNTRARPRGARKTDRFPGFFIGKFIGKQLRPNAAKVCPCRYLKN
jgi:hypothetical protein